MTDENDLVRLRSCIQDILKFLIEQIQMALSPNDQRAAIDVAKGAIPFLRSRLEKDSQSAARVVLSFPFGGYISQPDWSERWDHLANQPPDLFAREAEALIDCLSDCVNQIGMIPLRHEADSEEY